MSHAKLEFAAVDVVPRRDGVRPVAAMQDVAVLMAAGDNRMRVQCGVWFRKLTRWMVSSSEEPYRQLMTLALRLRKVQTRVVTATTPDEIGPLLSE